MGLWYLPGAVEGRKDACNDGKSMLTYALSYGKSSASIRDKCCLRGNYWPKEEVQDEVVQVVKKKKDQSKGKSSQGKK